MNLVEYLKPIAFALAVYMVPVWYLTEAAAWFFERRGTRKTIGAQLILRALPPVIAFVLALLSPGILSQLVGAFRGPNAPVEVPTFGAIVLFALVTGACAVQLHQWKIPQSLGTAIRVTIGRATGTSPGIPTVKVEKEDDPQ